MHAFSSSRQYEALFRAHVASTLGELLTVGRGRAIEVLRHADDIFLVRSSEVDPQVGDRRLMRFVSGCGCGRA